MKIIFKALLLCTSLFLVACKMHSQNSPPLPVLRCHIYKGGMGLRLGTEAEIQFISFDDHGVAFNLEGESYVVPRDRVMVSAGGKGLYQIAYGSGTSNHMLILTGVPSECASWLQANAIKSR